MSRNPEEPWRPPEPPGRPPRPPMPNRTPSGGSPRNRYLPWVIIGCVTLAVLVLFSNGPFTSTSTAHKFTFTELQSNIQQGF